LNQDACGFTFAMMGNEPRDTRKQKKNRRQKRVPKWRAMADEDGQYCFAVAL
jgi:hypothetical protein